MLYTAQYRYSGKDRVDITVKGRCPAGKMWAPTWDMVTGVKKGTMSEKEYTRQYYKLLTSRWSDSDFVEATMQLVDMSKDRDVTLVCFCPAGAFCHRVLLVTWLQHNWGIIYGGER